MSRPGLKSFNYAIGMFGTSIPINMLKTYAAIYYIDTLGMTAGDAIMGDSVPFSRVKVVQITASNLLAGDIVQVVTARGSTPILQAETNGIMQGVYTLEAVGFARVEILRRFIPGLPLLPALISNPIYFVVD